MRLLPLFVLALALGGCQEESKPGATPLPPNEAIKQGPPVKAAGRTGEPPVKTKPARGPRRTVEGGAPAPKRPSTISAPEPEWYDREDVGNIEIIREEDPVTQRFKEALELLELDKVEQAVALLEENVTAAPDDPVNHWNLASVHLALEQGEAALPPLREAVELDPENAEYALTLAGVELLMGDAEAAETLLGDLLEAHPEIPDVHYQLGLLHLAAARTDAALAAMKEATRLDPGHPEALTRLAILHVEAREWPEALAAVGAVRAAGDPEAAEAVEFLHGQILGKLGRCKDAAKILVKAREVGQADLADLSEGECWLIKQAPDKALPLLKAAAERTPGCQPCQMFLGDAHFVLGSWSAAGEAYQAAAAAEPADWRSRRQAGKCCLNLQRPADAVPLLEAAVELAAEDAEAWELLGRAYAASGNKAEAWTVMERLEKLGATERAVTVRQILIQLQ